MESDQPYDRFLLPVIDTLAGTTVHHGTFCGLLTDVPFTKSDIEKALSPIDGRLHRITPAEIAAGLTE